MNTSVTVGVLALQGAFFEHLKLLQQAVAALPCDSATQWEFVEVRNPSELARCNALIIPGGESTTMSLVASRSGLLEPLRDFVKYESVGSEAVVFETKHWTEFTGNPHGAHAPD